MPSIPPRRLFLLGDSISLGYGPFLEPLLGAGWQCDRKGSELLGAPILEEQRAAGKILRSLAGLDMGVTGLNGGDSRSVLAYLHARAAQPPGWSVLLLNCGLHDLRRPYRESAPPGEPPGGGEAPRWSTHQVDPGEYRANLAAILSLAAGLCERAVWVRTTPVDDDRHWLRSLEFSRRNTDVIAYNALADEVMRQAGVACIDLYAFTINLGLPPEALYQDHVHFVEPVRRLQAAYIAGWLEAGGHG